MEQEFPLLFGILLVLLSPIGVVAKIRAEDDPALAVGAGEVRV